MSTPFYDLASLVVVPSGYKSGKIYAQKPLTTDGQLTFTRASTATRVNASGLIETVASGVPRLDYLGSTCPKLLLEPQRTNSVQYSEQFSNAWWTKTFVTITSNAAAAPDGTVSADNFVPTTDNSGNHRVYDVNGSSVQTSTYSIFIKPNGHNYYALRESASTGACVGFNLATQAVTVTYSTGGCTASNGKVESYGNGWYRISATFSFASATNQAFGLYAAASTWTSGDVESVAWAGNGTIGAYIWGAQNEAGAYATSYIPTTSAAVTRLAEQASKTGISSLIGQTEGTLYWEGYVTPLNNWNSLMSLEEIGNYFFNIRLNTTNKIEAATSGFSNDFVITASTAASANTYYKIAGAYKSGQSVLYVNGVQIGTSAVTFTVPSLSEFRFNVFNVFNEQKSTAQALVFKTRLTNAQLAELTTL